MARWGKLTTNVPAELPPENVVVCIDNREQHPYTLGPLRTKLGTLTTGDYSIEHFEEEVVVERKSLPDLVACCGVERERFERELHRLRGIESRIVIVEASWADLQAGDWRSPISAKSVCGSVLGWMGWDIPFHFAGDRETADRDAARFLYIQARRRSGSCADS